MQTQIQQADEKPSFFKPKVINISTIDFFVINISL